MILSAQTIRKLELVTPLLERFVDDKGNSGGLGPCGVDLTLDQEVKLLPGDFRLASAVERIKLPNDIAGIVHDKSSLARLGLAVQNTICEPGWEGYLTLELTNHGQLMLILPQGASVCQIVFHRLDEPTELPYKGKYQNQERGPQAARREM